MPNLISSGGHDAPIHNPSPPKIAKGKYSVGFSQPSVYERIREKIWPLCSGADMQSLKERKIALEQEAKGGFSALFPTCGLPSVKIIETVPFGEKDNEIKVSTEDVREKCRTSFKEMFQVAMRSLKVGLIYKNILGSSIASSAFYENNYNSLGILQEDVEFRDAIMRQIKNTLDADHKSSYVWKQLKMAGAVLIYDFTSFFQLFIDKWIDGAFDQVVIKVKELEAIQKTGEVQTTLIENLTKFLRGLNETYGKVVGLNEDKAFRDLSLDDRVNKMLSKENVNQKTEKDFILFLGETFLKQIIGGSWLGYLGDKQGWGVPSLMAKFATFVLNHSGILDNLFDCLGETASDSDRKQIAYVMNTCISNILLGIKKTLIRQASLEQPPPISTQEKSSLLSLFTVLSQTILIERCNKDDKKQVKQMIENREGSPFDQYFDWGAKQAVDAGSPYIMQTINDLFLSESVFELSRSGIDSITKMLLERARPKSIEVEGKSQEKVWRDKRIEMEKMVEELLTDVLGISSDCVYKNNVLNPAEESEELLTLIREIDLFVVEYQLSSNKISKEDVYRKFVSNCYEKERSLRDVLRLPDPRAEQSDERKEILDGESLRKQENLLQTELSNEKNILWLKESLAQVFFDPQRVEERKVIERNLEKLGGESLREIVVGEMERKTLLSEKIKENHLNAEKIHGLNLFVKGKGKEIVKKEEDLRRAINQVQDLKKQIEKQKGIGLEESRKKLEELLRLAEEKKIGKMEGIAELADLQNLLKQENEFWVLIEEVSEKISLLDNAGRKANIDQLQVKIEEIKRKISREEVVKTLTEEISQLEEEIGQKNLEREDKEIGKIQEQVRLREQYAEIIEEIVDLQKDPSPLKEERIKELEKRKDEIEKSLTGVGFLTKSYEVGREWMNWGSKVVGDVLVDGGARAAVVVGAVGLNRLSNGWLPVFLGEIAIETALVWGLKGSDEMKKTMFDRMGKLPSDGIAEMVKQGAFLLSRPYIGSYLAEYVKNQGAGSVLQQGFLGGIGRDATNIVLGEGALKMIKAVPSFFKGTTPPTPLTPLEEEKKRISREILQLERKMQSVKTGKSRVLQEYKEELRKKRSAAADPKSSDPSIFSAYIETATILSKGKIAGDLSSDVLENLKKFSAHLKEETKKIDAARSVLRATFAVFLKGRYTDPFIDLIRKPFVLRYMLRYAVTKPWMEAEGAI